MATAKRTTVPTKTEPTTNRKRVANPALKTTGMSAAEVRAAMLAKLETSALTEAHGKKLKMQPYTAEECKALKLPATKAGFLIPYFTLDGKVDKFFRYRYLEDTRTGFDKLTKKKALRYAQPGNTTVGVYLPPLMDWEALAEDAEIPVIITEGELKAACATVNGMPTIGLGGVWSFMSKKAGEELVPMLKAFEWGERTVYICYDSDGATNPDVVLAEARLAQRLVELGAHLYICRIPHPQAEEGEPAKKLGIDDYIVEYGAQSFKDQVLELAFEWSGSEALHKLNQRVVYVRDPGIMWDHNLRQRMSPAAFKEHAFANIHYFERRATKNGETLVKVPAAGAWLQWEHRAECAGLDFAPGEARITEAGMLNTWTGWGLAEPVEGDITPWTRLLEHLFGDEKDSMAYFEKWCAYPLQNPGVKMHVAAAIWGAVHGSGKTLVGHSLMRIYGKHAAELKDADLENARFEWAENMQFALADDITSRGDRKFMRKLMTMVTQKYIRLDPKYIPSYVVRDLINYYFTSNDPDALFMDDQDRRFFVHEVLAGKLTWWREYVAWMKSEAGIAALWWHLLHLDTEGFDPHAPAPDTKGKRDMIELGKSDLGAWVYELKLNTDNVLERAKYRGDLFTAAELHLLYDSDGSKKASPNALGRELKRAGFNHPGEGAKLRLPDGRVIGVYAVRNQEYWRTAPWKKAVDHYIANHPELLAKPKGGKF